MREYSTDSIIDAVARACVEANCLLNGDVETALCTARDREITQTGRAVLSSLLENAALARRNGMAICQDTGMVVAFVELGQDARILGGLLTDAIEEGVRRGYRQGYLRNSVVSCPLQRTNTGDNTPAVIHFSLVGGDGLRIDLCPKGFGSENMSALAMLKPSDGIGGVRTFVVDTVSRAGANPCPPIVVGVGLGGTMEMAALLSKRALMRPIGLHSEQVHLAELESVLLDDINRLGIGPAGLGGRATALAVHVLSHPTHIAGLPVAVNISCHVTRHASLVF
jgi:fumarate hydratase subunit alpha